MEVVTMTINNINESVFNSVKKEGCYLGADDHDLDTDVLSALNTSLSILNQISSDVLNTHVVEDDETTWAEIMKDPSDRELFNIVKQYIVFKVRTLFNPSSNATLQNSMKENLSELEFRINSLKP